MEKLPREMSKRLYLRFSSLWGEKFTRHCPSDEFIEIWWQDWEQGLSGISGNHIKEALDYCRLNLDWPPSLAEFRRLCEKVSGIPSLQECLTLAIRRDFTHPIIAMAFDKIGSWAMKNDKEEVLRDKFKDAYNQALNEFRKDPNEAILKLEAVKARVALPSPPEKIPSQQEIISWRERLEKWKEMATADKAKLEEKDHPVWDKKKITRGHRDFDEIMFNERKRYLIELDETTAQTLSQLDWYDRTRYFREVEANDKVKNNKPIQYEPINKKTPSRPYNVLNLDKRYWQN